VVIATKFGFKSSLTDPSKWTELESRQEQIKEVAEASLKRLRLMLWIYSINTALTPTCQLKTLQEQ
jgi:aryl-alcohol dehydrogenase-like predicted oxidoreductase